MMDSKLENDALLGEVVDDFFRSIERGKSPTVQEYVEAYPEIAELIQVAIPAMLAAHDPPTCDMEEYTATSKPKQLGDFKILRQLGRGGMGIVYEADQISMNRRVALKVLALAGLVDDLKIRRFRNEVRAVAALDHPNVVSVYLVGEERGVHYYAMQLVQGRDLAKIIYSLREIRRSDGGLTLNSIEEAVAREQEVQLPTAEVDTVAKADSTTPQGSASEYYRNAAVLGIQAANALQHAHDQGVIHRDIKPANLMVDRSSNLYVTDFGLARIETDAGVTMTGDVLGTLRYMAPEQALSQHSEVDHRSDIYSLAVTLYELLSLELAYDASDRRGLLKLIANQEPTKLRKIDATIPIELETIIHKGMAKERIERYSTAGEFADDLSRFLDHRPILAKPPTWSQRTSKWIRRNPSIAASIGAALLMLAATLGLSSMLVANQRDTAIQSANTMRSNLYISDMNVAFQAWERRNLLRTSRLLSRWIPDGTDTDLRGVEWDDLASRAKSHRGKPIGKFWEKSLTISTQRKRLAGVSGGDLIIVDLESQQSTTIIENLSPKDIDVGQMRFSPDGKKLAIATAEGIRLFDLSNYESHFLPGSSSSPVAFSPDGKWGAHVEVKNSTIYIWETTTGAQVWSYDELPRVQSVRAIDFASDSETLVLVFDQKVNALNFRSGESREVETDNEFTRAMKMVGPRTLLVGGVRGLAEVSLETQKEGESPHQQIPWLPDTKYVWAFDISSDHGRLALGTEGNAIEVWDLKTSTLLLRQYRSRRIRNVFFVDGANGVVVSSDNFVERIDLNQQAQSTLTSASRYNWTDCVGVLNGEVVVAGPGQRLLFWTPDVGITRKLEFGDDDNYEVRSIAVSRNGTTVASSSRNRDGIIRLWNGATLEIEKTIDSEEDFPAIALTADARYLAVGCDGISVWDTDSGKVKWKGPKRTTTASICFSPDGKRLVSGGGNWHDSGMLSIWNVEGNHISLIKDFEHREMVMCLAVSADNRWLVGGDYSGQIVVYDLRKSAVHSVINAHSMAVQSFAWSPDGRTLVSGAYDGSMKYWNVATWKQLGATYTPDAVQGLAFVQSKTRGLGLLVGTRATSYEPATQRVFWTNIDETDWDWLQAGSERSNTNR